MLTADFASRKPVGLRRLIIANACADFQLRCKGRRDLREELPQDIRDILIKHSEEGTESSPEYQSAFSIFSSKFICSISPPPPDLQESVDIFMNDKNTTDTMEGPHDFHCVGTLENWSMVERARDIGVDTLLLNGQREIATDLAVMPFWREIGRVKWLKMMGSTHSPHFEERERYFEVVGGFLVDV